MLTLNQKVSARRGSSRVAHVRTFQYVPDMTTAERFTDAINGARELADMGYPAPSRENLMGMLHTRFMVGAKQIEDGREGFTFIDGSSAWRRQTDNRWVAVSD